MPAVRHHRRVDDLRQAHITFDLGAAVHVPVRDARAELYRSLLQREVVVLRYLLPQADDNLYEPLLQSLEEENATHADLLRLETREGLEKDQFGDG